MTYNRNYGTNYYSTKTTPMLTYVLSFITVSTISYYIRIKWS